MYFNGGKFKLSLFFDYSIPVGPVGGSMFLRRAVATAVSSVFVGTCGNSIQSTSHGVRIES